MIPTICQTATYGRYSTRLLPAQTPVIDIGTATDIFQRANITGKGKRQKQFLEAAIGKIVIRVGFDMVALEHDDFDELVSDAYNQLTVPAE